MNWKRDKNCIYAVVIYFVEHSKHITTIIIKVFIYKYIYDGNLFSEQRNCEINGGNSEMRKFLMTGNIGATETSSINYCYIYLIISFCV
jgi:hypothetical protein